MPRKSSRILSIPSIAASSSCQVGNNHVLCSGTADAGLSPQSSQDESGSAAASVPSSTLPPWVLNRAANGSGTPLKSETEELATSEDYLTVAEAAWVLRVSVRTLRRHLAAGKIPHIRVGRQVRILREPLLRGV